MFFRLRTEPERLKINCIFNQSKKLFLSLEYIFCYRSLMRVKANHKNKINFFLYFHILSLVHTKSGERTPTASFDRQKLITQY